MTKQSQAGWSVGHSETKRSANHPRRRRGVAATRVGSRAGVGACGRVYGAAHAETRRPAAVKVALTEEGRRALATEYLRLGAARRACGGGVVAPLAFLESAPSPEGPEGSALVMERLGPSVDDLWWAATCGTGFSGATALALARDLLPALAGLASADLVHRDVKPSNWLVGLDDDAARRAPETRDIFGTSGFVRSDPHRGPTDDPRRGRGGAASRFDRLPPQARRLWHVLRPRFVFGRRDDLRGHGALRVGRGAPGGRAGAV